MKDNTRRYTANNLRLIDKFYSMVISKTKTSTIRLGYVFFVNEILTLKFSSQPDLNVRIAKIDYSKCLKDIKDEDAKKDGFENFKELYTELIKFYPNIDKNTQFTIVHFDIIE